MIDASFLHGGHLGQREHDKGQPEPIDEKNDYDPAGAAIRKCQGGCAAMSVNSSASRLYGSGTDLGT